MKKILLITAFLAGLTMIEAKAQDMDFTKTNYRYVANATGLVLRDKPDANANKITTIADREALLVFDSKVKKATVNGVDGYWKKVYYKDQFGYVFDAYLKDYATAQDRKPAEQIYSANYNGVKPKGGLYLRTKPSQKSDAILLMPYHSAVVVLEAKSYGDEVIEGKKGSWRKVRWEDKVGYAFDAYLTKNIKD